jgi:hypothetical protein
MRGRGIAAPIVLACCLAAPARAEQAAPRDQEPSHPASPFHGAIAGELLLGGELANIPLTLYGAGAEAGYRLRPRIGGIVFTPFVAGHLMRGHTPAGLLFTAASYAGGLDLAIERRALLVHFMGELGRSENSIKRATNPGEYEVLQMTGQVLLAMSYRTSPWFAFRAGVGYRFIGQVGGAVLVVGGML